MDTKKDPHSPYTLYKLDISYFSGKVEAYLKYKGIEYDAVEVNYFTFNEVALGTGTKKVPAMRSADGSWLYDSTTMLQWFEKNYTQSPILPTDPALAFIALLVEDYADEWLWKPAMWWRWMPKPSRFALGIKMGGEIFTPILARPMGWFFKYRQLREWLWDDGVTKHNHKDVKDMLFKELDFLESLFEQQAYIMGSHPSAADFGYFASMFRHFGNDPSSSEIIRRRAPNTYEWLARLWNARADKLPSTQSWIWPDQQAWHALLERIAKDYLPYLHQNALAYQQSLKRFDYQGEHFTFNHSKTTRYRVYCREVLQNAFAALNEHDKQRVNALFEPCGTLEALFLDGVIESGMKEALRLPIAANNKVINKPSLKVRLFGQPRN